MTCVDSNCIITVNSGFFERVLFFTKLCRCKMVKSLYHLLMYVTNASVANFKITYMYFNVCHENKILMKYGIILLQVLDIMGKSLAFCRTCCWHYCGQYEICFPVNKLIVL